MITLSIPEASPSMNEMKGKHWSHYHGMRRHWSMLVLVAKTEAHVPFRDPFDKAVVRILREGRRLLDFDNLVGGTKVLTDSLREQRLIVDDSPAHLTITVSQRLVPRNGYPRTIVEIDG